MESGFAEGRVRGDVETAGMALSELSRPSVSRKRISELSKKLQSTDRLIQASVSGVLKYYYMLEMTDIDYGDFSSVAKQLDRRYSRLGGMTAAVVSALDDLRLGI